MNTTDSKKEQMEITLSNILRGGLILSMLCLGIGAIIFLWQSGSQPENLEIIVGEHNHLNSLQIVLRSIISGDSYAILQLGIIILILTPVLRVATCLWMFCLQRDLLYILVSSVVLLILLTSLFINANFGGQ